MKVYIQAGRALVGAQGLLLWGFGCKAHPFLWIHTSDGPEGLCAAAVCSMIVAAASAALLEFNC